MNNIFEIQEDPMTHQLFIQLTEDVIKELNIDTGDKISWNVQPDGSVLLSKKEREAATEADPEEKELVMVDAICQYRMRYVVEVPKGKAEWALDTVTMNEAEEFSQQYLGETIASHRVVTHEEVIAQFNVDNDYLASWPDTEKRNRFITRIQK